MKKIFLFIVLTLAVSFISKAENINSNSCKSDLTSTNDDCKVQKVENSNKYNLNEETLEQTFNNAIEVDGESFLFEGNTISKVTSEDKRVIAGVLGIFCGSVGLHRFYLGHTKAGLAYLGFTLLCGGGATLGTVVCFPLAFGVPLVVVPGIIDGIIYLFASNDEFESKYAHNEKIIQWGDTKDKK